MVMPQDLEQVIHMLATNTTSLLGTHQVEPVT